MPSTSTFCDCHDDHHHHHVVRVNIYVNNYVIVIITASAKSDKCSLWIAVETKNKSIVPTHTKKHKETDPRTAD